MQKKLTKDKYDHLGACYAGCGTGAKLSPSVQGQIIFADEAEVTAYPNPFNTELHVFIQAAKPEPISITVYDLSGRVVENVTDAETNTEITLGSSLASGMYLLQVKDGNTKKMLKIVKN